MSLTAPGIKGVVIDSMNATPSATVAFQAVSSPAGREGYRFHLWGDLFGKSLKGTLSAFTAFFRCVPTTFGNCNKVTLCELKARLSILSIT